MNNIKSTTFLLLLSLLIYSPGKTQDYTTILIGETHIFETMENVTIRDIPPGKYVRAVKTDSIDIIGNDTVIYFQNEIVCSDNQNPYNAECNIGPSWLGSGVIKKENSDEIFYSIDSSEILIKTDAILNEKWVLWESENGSYIEAEITKHDFKTFLSVVDSVKEITLTYFNKTGNIVEDTISGNRLELSKNYGLISTYNFRDFPFNSRNEEIILHELKGCSKDNLGLRIMTKGDVYDYEVGDEFHTEEERIYEYAGLRNAIKKILKKTYSTNRDSIKYTIQEKWRYNYPSQGIDIDTFIFEVNGLDETLDFLPSDENGNLFLPFEAIKTNEQEYSNYIMFSSEKYNGRYQLIYPAEFIYESEYRTELFFILEILRYTYFTAIKGCGVYHKKVVYADPDIQMDSINLVYFKKGESTWGEPLLLNSIEDYNLNSIVKVYPNPATEHISLKWDGANSNDIVTYSIIDVFGSIHNEGKLNLYSYSIINISNLEPGIYFLFFPELNITKKIIKL